MSDPPAPTLFVQPKANCACGGGCPRCRGEFGIQPKLRIGQPNDKYEQEADRVTERVMRMPETQVQRQSDEEEEEEKLLQPKAFPGQTPAMTSDLASHIQGLHGGGQPLPKPVRTFFEPRFGWDFSSVRVHTGGQASDLARGVQARAFTVDQDLVFGAGQYGPRTMAGKRLLAHELAHVIQQTHHNLSHLQRFTVDDSCRSTVTFLAEQQGNMQCQDGSTVPNGTVYNLSFATLPNRCPGDRYNVHSARLVDRAVQRAIAVVSSSSRPEHCLREGEFQRGVLNILRATTISCERDRGGPATAGMFTNTIQLRHSDIHGDSPTDIEALAGAILHEALHIWEGRFGLLQHTGIVTPCTAACFPRSGQAMVNTNPRNCIMPPLVRGSTISVGTQVEATRGGGLGAVLSYRRTLFNTLRGHLTGQLGLDVSYEHLFSSEAARRYGSDTLRLTPVLGLTLRPGIQDRRGLLFNLDLGPSTEISQTGTQTGFRFNLGAGLEFDFLTFGTEVGIVVPITDDAQTTLDFMVQAGISF